MEAMALELQGVTKQYGDFTLDHISFTVPKGSIVGLIGENGAGKSTTINAVLGLIHTQEGTVRLLGSRGPEEVNREEMGVVFDGNNYPTMLTPRQMGKVFPGLYRSWDEEKYREILERFQIPANKKIKEFSKGMKMKYSIAVAFSHHVKLLILDEATSGLDPIMRDEVLDMLLEFIQDEDHAVLVSSHITSDLEKVADYIVFLHKGKIIFSSPKDDLLENYGIIKCSADQFAKIRKEDILSYRKLDCEWQVLVANRHEAKKKYPQALVVPASLDEIMLLYVKGEEK